MGFGLVSFWRTCERADFVSDVPVIVWFVSFWRTCERMEFRQFLA